MTSVEKSEEFRFISSVEKCSSNDNQEGMNNWKDLKIHFQ